MCVFVCVCACMSACVCVCVFVCVCVREIERERERKRDSMATSFYALSDLQTWVSSFGCQPIKEKEKRFCYKP